MIMSIVYTIVIWFVIGLVTGAIRLYRCREVESDWEIIRQSQNNVKEEAKFFLYQTIGCTPDEDEWSVEVWKYARRGVVLGPLSTVAWCITRILS